MHSLNNIILRLSEGWNDDLMIKIYPVLTLYDALRKRNLVPEYKQDWESWSHDLPL